MSENGLSLTFSPLQRFHQGVPSIEPPISGTNISVTQSFPTMLTCDVDAKPEAEVTWFKIGGLGDNVVCELSK
ncbi:hypothetical protein Anas_07056 [Armadillidium nasatum]|uniref:Ig-like domain-containing protein n=1 Tax=Armadillidium nasatum TaxID=96803 RepID=A0A5N5SRL1_9CRUS|nr:hypothetical protein Anas_07056 [Armadillidium nasatum]